MKICLAGEGAFGNKHLDALACIEDVEVVSLVGGVAEETRRVADERGIPHWSLDLKEGLSQPGVEAVILATPTPLHASQAMDALRLGKHVLVEIPMADNLEDAEALVALQRETGLVAMAGHVRRFNPSHQWINERIAGGQLSIQQLNVQTYFFRRSNLNALGQPRSWTDHLLWHHACHTVDLFMYQTGEEISECYAAQGPMDEELGITMDMAIVMKSTSGAICNLSLSFNNDGPLGTHFRYICDAGTYVARYDDLYDGNDNRVDVSGVDISMNGIELIDREFLAAIKYGREPNGSVSQCLPAMRVLQRIQRQLIS